MSVIVIHDLTRQFGPDVHAVDGISLEIGRGEIVALLGPNGAGKTTTLDMLLGFIAPTSGSIEVFGEDPRQSVRDARVGAMLQTGGLLRDLKVGETIELIASTYPDPAPIGDVVKRAGLEGVTDRLVSKCSGGEQQRVKFALALLASPELLILDEPTTGLDVDARTEFWQSTMAEAKDGRTIVFATHYLHEAELYAARTVLMVHGKIIADGPTEEIRSHAAGTTVEATVPHGSATIGQLRQNSAVAALDIEDLDGQSRLHIRTSDSDAVARELLNADGTNLQIRTGSLDDAFTNLVGETQ